MKMKRNNHRKISAKFGLAFAVAFAVAIWLPATVRADDHEDQGHAMLEMEHITTQAQAEALKPGDFISMACAKCKSVMVQKVTGDKGHVKMMTAGKKVMCHACDGMVSVVATGKGKGKGKEAEVEHVCSKCGEDAMFVCATKPGETAE